MNQEQLVAEATALFTHYPTSTAFHFTNDGQAFHSEGDAKNHAKQLDPAMPTVNTVTKDADGKIVLPALANEQVPTDELEPETSTEEEQVTLPTEAAVTIDAEAEADSETAILQVPAKKAVKAPVAKPAKKGIK